MPKTREQYLVAGTDLYYVRNRNERRVAECLRETIERLGPDALTPDMIKDVYALALNKLPARYAQHGTIILREPVRKAEIEGLVASSLEHVMKNPK